MPIMTPLIVLAIVTSVTTMLLIQVLERRTGKSATVVKAPRHRRRIGKAEQFIVDGYEALRDARNLLDDPRYANSPNRAFKSTVEQAMVDLRTALEADKPHPWVVKNTSAELASCVDSFLRASGIRWQATCTGCGAGSGTRLSRGEAVDAARRAHTYLTISNPHPICGPLGHIEAVSVNSDSINVADPPPAEGRVAAIKDTIGALRLDIGWVIDHPAFFATDSTVSADVFAALGEWDDTRHTLTPPQANELAERIESLFTAAKTRAEQVGHSHLHGQTRTAVEKASRLVRKAGDPATPKQEAALLMSKAAEVLAGVVETVMPAETIRELETLAAAKQITT